MTCFVRILTIVELCSQGSVSRAAAVRELGVILREQSSSLTEDEISKTLEAYINLLLEADSSRDTHPDKGGDDERPRARNVRRDRSESPDGREGTPRTSPGSSPEPDSRPAKRSRPDPSAFAWSAASAVVGTARRLPESR